VCPYLTTCTLLLPVAAGLSWMLDPATWWVILQVALGLGFVIFVHELGHFLVAKACGVKCEKFFLGFDVGGAKLLSFTWGETEYGIGALPLGGYVKMLGQDDNPAAAAEEARRARDMASHHDVPSGDLPPEPTSDPHPAWDPRSYPAQSVPKRMAIISAGVIMNVIFAVLMASWAFGLGVREMTCVISSVRPAGAAWKAGLRTGDEIVRIGGQQRPIFNDLRYGVTVGSVKNGIAVEFRRPGDDSPHETLLHPDTDLGAPTIGVTNPWSLTLPAEVGKALVGAAAAAAPPLAGGDTIRAVNDLPVTTYAELIAALARVVDRPVSLAVDRTTDGTPQAVTVVLPPQPALVTGMTMTARRISAVQADSPAAVAGLAAGDRIVAIDGEDPGDPLSLDHRLAARAGQTVRLTVAAGDGPPRELDIVPRDVTWLDNEASWPASPASIASLGVALVVDAEVAAVAAGGPADRAGVIAGDRVVRAWFLEPDPPAARSVDEGVEISQRMPNWPAVDAVLQRVRAGTRLRLSLEGAGGPREVTLEPVAAADRFVVDRGLAFEPDYTVVRAGSLNNALGRGLRRAGQDLSLVWGFLGKLTRSEISPRLLGGPIEIAKQAGRSAQEGFGRLLLFLTMLSANLAVVNFLPIPVLDGGHMVFLLYELVRGKPPSEKVVVALSYVGLALILSLMMFVFGLDLGLIPRR
jgi:regulator of sigma E protease